MEIIREILSRCDKLNKLAISKIDDIIISYNDETIIKHFSKSGRLHELRSLSKYITSLAIGIWLDECKLELTTNVWSLLDAKKLEMDNHYPTTIHHLLCQSAGYNDHHLLMTPYTKINQKNYLQFLEELCQDYCPGMKFVYSNASYYLLSVLFKTVTGQDFYDFINGRLYSPMGITNSKCDYWGDYCAGATGFYLSSNDLHRISCLINSQGVYEHKQIIPYWYLSKMTQKQIDIGSYKCYNPFNPVGYGYGIWYVNHHLNYVSGANGQYIVWDKSKNIVITMLSSGGNLYPLLSDVFNLLN